MPAIPGPNGKPLFTAPELACRCGCRLLRLDSRFEEALTALRLEFGEPMIVNSCCRCEQHNEAVGGHKHSLHVADYPVHAAQGTMAIDIRSTDVAYRWRLCRLAMKQGWSVGSAKTFLHLDRRIDLGMAPGEFPY